MPRIWAWLDALPAAERPALLRGDIAYGNESVLREAEARNQPYLTKLRLTKNVQRLVTKLFTHPDWEKAGQGWQGREDTLQLSGWSRPRRVIVLRRPIRGDVLIAAQDDLQLSLAFIESKATAAAYEYAVLVTSTDYEARTLAQLYRDRADAENNFDELKNQWGVRPGSRLRVCFTGQGGPDETGCSINRSLPRHAEPVTARCEALGTM